MKPNLYGQIANQQWQWLQTQYPYIISHAFVVMPNHIHAVVQINHQLVRNTAPCSDSSRAVPTGCNADTNCCDCRDRSRPVPAVPIGITAPAQSIKIKSVSGLIGAYKTTVSKQIHLIGGTNFQWQRSFFDHIIRNDKAYIRIIDYIQTNPQNWDNDTLFN